MCSDGKRDIGNWRGQEVMAECAHYVIVIEQIVATHLLF